MDVQVDFSGMRCRSAVMLRVGGDQVKADR
jgi:hypothetical protein